MQQNKPEPINNKEADFCETMGIIGLLISIACTLQHLYFIKTSWISCSVLIPYIYSMVVFVMLAKKSEYAFLLLCISAALLTALELFMIVSLVYSPLVIILLLYTAVMAILLFTSGYPAKLKALANVRRMEADEWAGKI